MVPTERLVRGVQVWVGVRALSAEFASFRTPKALEQLRAFESDDAAQLPKHEVAPDIAN
jgi:hypothetical protein